MKKKKKTRRGRGGNKKCKNISLKIVGNNCAGLKGKEDSFENLLKIFSPAIVMLQETKLYKRGTMKFSEFECFEKLRNDNEGGGLMTLVHKNFNKVLIPTKNQSKMSVNILVVAAKIRNMKIRFINAYGVQECAAVEEKSDFYSSLEQEIIIAIDSRNMLCVSMDANAKLGKNCIEGDPHNISQNGRLLLNIIDRLNLVVVNSTNKCHGKITRMKKVKNKVEESIIDYFIVCQDFYLFINSMMVDDERNFVMTKYTKKREKSFTTESDHNTMVLDVNIPWDSKKREERIEIFNLRNRDCQKEFFKNTNSGNMLTKCFLNKSIQEGGKLWINHLKSTILKSFRKIRITKRKNKEDMEISKLFKQNKNVNEYEKEEIKKKICEKIFLKNRKIILIQIMEMVDNTSNLSRIRMWRIKQKIWALKMITIML